MATQISATQFKERCLALLDQLDSDGLVITKHGKPVARVLPAASDCGELIGVLKGKIRVEGDIFSTGVSWDAES
jgi:prevent-host-death family protein